MHKQPISVAEVVQIPIDQIVIGPRRRDKPGNLRALAKSIEAHGLIHPIVLQGDRLIAGGRRIEACRLLHWKTIPARQVDRLSDEERYAIELDENTAREPLSDYATSAARLAQIRQAEADLKAKAATEFRSKTDRNSKRGRANEGRPPKAGSTREVAAETGISIAERDRVERHVELADRFPFLKRDGWVRYLVLDAGDALDRIPVDDRGPIAAIVDQPAIPAKTAITMLRRAADLPTKDRRAVIDKSRSPDELVRRTATTILANVPPPPDPGLLALNDAVEACKKAATRCRSTTFAPRIRKVSDQVIALRDEFRAHEQEVRTREQRAN